MRQHCTNMYYDPLETSDHQRYRIAVWRSRHIAARLHGEASRIHWTFGLTLQARARLKGNRVSGGRETLVSEVLHKLPLAVVSRIHDTFVSRFQGLEIESTASWKCIEMCFIAKVRHAEKLKDHRGIGLLSAMSKWYMSCAIELAYLSVPAHMAFSWHSVCCFGFESEHSAEMLNADRLLEHTFTTCFGVEPCHGAVHLWGRHQDCL